MWAIRPSPQVTLLSNGGAAFVWQSTVNTSVKVYARFVNAEGTFATGDIAVSASPGEQSFPVVASLAGGNVVVAWSSMGQERSASGQPVVNGLEGVFAQMFSPAGEKIGAEFQVNSTLPLNQRNPAVTPLSNGGFVVAWVSEIYQGVQFGVDTSGRGEAGAGIGQLRRHRSTDSSTSADGPRRRRASAQQRCPAAPIPP